MEEDERLTIVRKRTLARMKKKTLNERIKSFVRGHIHMDDDWRTPLKLKKEKHAYTYDYSIERGDGARIKTRREGSGLVATLIKTFASKKKESFAVFGAPKKTLKGRAAHVKKRAKNAAYHVKKHAKNHFSFAHNNPALEYLGRWERKYHRALHVLSFLIPVLILGYIIYMNILPFGHTASLYLNVGTEGDMDSTADIYLSDPNKALTPVQRYGGETFREVTAEKPFYLNFYAPINIDNRTRVTMDMDYEGDSPVYIEYFDELTNKTYWRRYYGPGFRPELAGYVPIANFGTESIFAKRDLLEFKCRQLNFTYDCAQEWYWYKDWYFNDSVSDLDEWLVENALYESVYFYNRLVEQEDYVNTDVGYVDGEWTEINTQLRGTHEFYVYLNESLNLTVWKQDHNSYEGNDVVSVVLQTMNGTTVFKDTIPDDGIIDTSRNKSDLITRNMLHEIKESGIYLLKLQGIKDRKSHHDYRIEKIKINTNKIITKGTIHPLSKTKLYTNAKLNSPISFYYWHKNKYQNVIVEGEDNKTIILSKENQSQKVFKTISGKNTIYFPKGDLYISSDIYFSFNESSYFEPFLFDFDYSMNPSYLIYDGSYRSWIYKKDSIALMSDNVKIKSIKLVFKHESI